MIDLEKWYLPKYSGSCVNNASYRMRTAMDQRSLATAMGVVLRFSTMGASTLEPRIEHQVISRMYIFHWKVN